MYKNTWRRFVNLKIRNRSLQKVYVTFLKLHNAINGNHIFEDWVTFRFKGKTCKWREGTI